MRETERMVRNLRASFSAFQDPLDRDDWDVVFQTELGLFVGCKVLQDLAGVAGEVAIRKTGDHPHGLRLVGDVVLFDRLDDFS